jgi:hypothetical protein
VEEWKKRLRARWQGLEKYIDWGRVDWFVYR